MYVTILNVLCHRLDFLIDWLLGQDFLIGCVGYRGRQQLKQMIHGSYPML
jgi:hypothetical protein